MYQHIFNNILNPLYESAIKRRNMLKYHKFLGKSQWWSLKELQRFQYGELSRLLQNAYENVPYWRRLFDKLSLKPIDIKNEKDLHKLPIIDKNDIRNNYDEMIATNYKNKTWKKSTGGSTGAPLHFEYTPESYDWRVATSKRGYLWAGCEAGIKQAYIWGANINKVSALQRIKENLHHAILRQKYFNCFKFNEEEMKRTLLALNRYKPAIIVGYTNPLYEFAKFASGCDDLKFKPKAIISAAEKLHDFQRKEISKVFGCEVFNTYGSREFMLIASECDKHDGLHVNMENLVVEVIKEDGSPAKPDEIGEIVITDLHNYGMPFIRYKIGDMAIPSDKQCQCGRGLPLLKDVTGRSLDIIKTSDGKNIPGEFFPHLMKEFQGVKQFQVVQDKIDHLLIRIVKKDELLDSKLSFMKNEIKKVTGTTVKVDISFVEDIPLTSTGKYRVTISELNNNTGA